MFTQGLSEGSVRYGNMPSLSAREMFFYPIQLGNSLFAPGFRWDMGAADGYMLAFVREGALALTYRGTETQVLRKRFMLLDCRHPYTLQSLSPGEMLWMRLNGPLAGRYYEDIIAKLGHVFTTDDSFLPAARMDNVLFEFSKGVAVSEPYISKLLNDTLTFFLLQPPADEQTRENADVIIHVIHYIRERYRDNLTNEVLAACASMSPWHFIRIFKRETGMTPHQYVMRIRFQAAEFLLRSTEMHTREISYQAGFASESVFCTAFKKHTGMTPGEYRRAGRPAGEG